MGVHCAPAVCYTHVYNGRAQTGAAAHLSTCFGRQTRAAAVERRAHTRLCSAQVIEYIIVLYCTRCYVLVFFIL